VKRSDFTDGAWGRILQERYDALSEHHANGLVDEHPSASFNRDSATLRRVARDSLPGNSGEAKEIEELDHTADDPPPTTGAARVPERPGAAAAAHDRAARDAALEELAIRQSGAADVEARIHLSRLKRGNSTAASRSAMDQMIPGYDRLGGRDTNRMVDDDGIVTRRK
jgi:hypothetical protein